MSSDVLDFPVEACPAHFSAWFDWWADGWWAWTLKASQLNKLGKEVALDLSLFSLVCFLQLSARQWCLLGSNYSPCCPAEPPWWGWEAMLLLFLHKTVLWSKLTWAARYQSWHCSLLVLETNLYQKGQVSEPICVCGHPGATQIVKV